MEEREREGGGKVRALIEKATATLAPEVDARYLKAIKCIVRYSDSELKLAAETLMDLMKTNNSEVRYLALLIIDELFMRSKLFRGIIVGSLDRLLNLSVGFRGGLPGPEAVAVRLRTKGIEFLEKWNVMFGLHYRQIRLGFDYLKNTLKYQFPNIQANVERMERERAEREMRTKEILMKKYETLKRNFSEIKKDIHSTIDEIGECLDILSEERKRVSLLDQLDDESEQVEFRSAGLWQLRLETLKEGEKFHESTDNKVVIDALNESHRVLVTKHLVSVQEWTSMLVRVDAMDDRCRESMLKEFIDLRNHILLTQEKCKKAGCTLSDVGHDGEDVIWEEGDTEVAQLRNPGKKPDQNVDVISETNSKDKAPETSELKKETMGVESSLDLDPVKKKLLAEAPIVKWGTSFHNWSSNNDVMANYRGLDLQSHWGRVDQDAVIPADRIAELNYQATVYEEERVEIQPCHAPLKKGGLCQRRDLKVCPFHGPIVPRDSEGNPVNTATSLQDDESGHKSSQTDGETPDSESEVLEKLARQAIKNVRRREEEEMKDKKALKRAKLLKVREHNKAVLRDAALASTSISASVGEDLEIKSDENSASSSKKRKKAPPTKTRIADKLRNIHSKNATLNCPKLKMHQW